MSCFAAGQHPILTKWPSPATAHNLGTEELEQNPTVRKEMKPWLGTSLFLQHCCSLLNNFHLPFIDSKIKRLSCMQRSSYTVMNLIKGQQTRHWKAGTFMLPAH